MYFILSCDIGIMLLFAGCGLFIIHSEKVFSPGMAMRWVTDVFCKVSHGTNIVLDSEKYNRNIRKIAFLFIVCGMIAFVIGLFSLFVKKYFA